MFNILNNQLKPYNIYEYSIINNFVYGKPRLIISRTPWKCEIIFYSQTSENHTNYFEILSIKSTDII